MTKDEYLARLSVLTSRIAAFFSQAEHLHQARFAHPHELTSLLSSTLEDPASLLLGISPHNQILRVCPTPTRRELGNLLVTAPTRGGKGLLAVSQLLTWKQSVIVSDIKGELFAQTAGYRSTLGKVYVIDPEGVGHRYDPLLNKQTEKDLLSASTHLLYHPNEGEGRIFTERATVMLTQLFLAARTENAPPLPYVREMIRLGLVGAAKRLAQVSPHLATQFLDARLQEANFDDRFLVSCWGTLSAKMRLLLTDALCRSFSGADFTAGDILRADKPVTVYLRLPERDLLVLTPLVRLLWESLISELIHTWDSVSGKSCQPVLLLIDEAGTNPVPALNHYAATVVGRGISLWVAIQDLSQLEAVYGKHKADTIKNNMDSQLFYRQSSQETAEYIERCLGKRSGFAHSQSLHAGEEKSQGLSEQAISLMTAQEVKEMGDEEIIGFHHNLSPFKLKRLDWRRFPLLAKRRSIPPPQLSELPALAKSPHETEEQTPTEAASWQLAPDLVRRGSPAPSTNGFRKKMPGTAKSGFRPLTP